MNNRIRLCAIALVWVASAASATDFDGSEPLLCSTATLSECLPGGVCRQVTAESINAPDFLRLDFSKKTLTTVTANLDDPPPSAIENTATIDEKLFVQGSDDGIEGIRDGVAWSLAIDQNSGKMVLTASGDSVGFVIFGACTPL